MPRSRRARDFDFPIRRGAGELNLGPRMSLETILHPELDCSGVALRGLEVFKHSWGQYVSNAY
jgi:hypothetical protein